MTARRPQRGQRVQLGITGLDTVLHGGLLKGGVYIIQGAPGAGKTILANQACFAHARSGGTAAYVTLLAEAHARMMMHLESLSFFDPAMVQGRVQYFSGFRVLEDEGLRGVLDLLRREMRARKATLLIVDGLVALSESAQSATDFKKFIHELQLHADLAGCTVLLLTGAARPPGLFGPEQTMVDGVIELGDVSHGLRAYRELTVKKFRGSAALRGAHFYRITSDGIVLHPRIESLYADPPGEGIVDHRSVSTGTQHLDKMLGAGLPAGSITMVMGPSGSGKTTLGLHYLAKSSRREKGLHFGFYETPERLRLKARSLGLPLDARIRAKDVEIIWRPSTERTVDELVHDMLEGIERTGAKRLFLDGLDGLQRAAVHEQRVHHVFTALANELRVRGVTTLCTFEIPKFIGPTIEAPVTGVSAIAENLIVLRFVELRTQLYRLLSILKVRDRDYDTSIREFIITGQGIELSKTFESAEEILRGVGRVVGVETENVDGRRQRRKK